jgi:Choline/Carnitine o-acyltransferase
LPIGITVGPGSHVGFLVNNLLQTSTAEYGLPFRLSLIMLNSSIRSSPRPWLKFVFLLRRKQMSTSRIKLTQRPSGWKTAAPAAPPGTQTYSSELPKLQVPDLQETLGRLKQSLKPIAWSDLEYSSVEKKINEFGVSKGPELQERLLNRAGETPHWLEEWWDDTGYLGYRDSVRCQRSSAACRWISSLGSRW